MSSDLIQLSPEWHKAREGKLTGSNAAAAIGLNKYQSKQKLYREILGIDDPFEGNEMTAYGTEHEADAIYEYEAFTGALTAATGFWVHPENDWLGASPDALCGSDGIIEAKCRFSGELWEEVPVHYQPQLIMEMACTGRQWVDFVSWNPEAVTIQKVGWSQDYWDAMLPLMVDFWSCVSNEEPPPRKKKPVMPELSIERIVGWINNHSSSGAKVCDTMRSRLCRTSRLNH